MAFLCLEHHSTYDSESSQHKNYTEIEVKRYREDLYKQLAGPRPKKLTNPLPASEDTQAAELRMKDLQSIKSVFSTIHWPTLDEHISELPYRMIPSILYFWEAFHATVSSSLFHIYDPMLAREVQELGSQWDLTVSFGNHYMGGTGKTLLFTNPRPGPLSIQQEKDWEKIVTAARLLAEAKKRLLDHVRRDFEEIDITKLSDKAWSNYAEPRKRILSPVGPVKPSAG